MTSNTSHSALVLRGASNFRDAGGHPITDGGRMREGWLYRSEALHALQDEDIEQLAAMPLRVICDLRAAKERASQPNRLPPEWAGEQLLVPDGTDSGSGDLLHAFDTGIFGDAANARHYMLRIYRAMPETYAPTLRGVFQRLLNDRVPILVHCTAGKDRTGFVCAMVQSALGVAEDAVMADYLASDRHFGASRLSALIEARSGMPPASDVVDALRVREEYLAATLARIRETHGSVESYLRDVTDLSEKQLAELRATLTAH